MHTCVVDVELSRDRRTARDQEPRDRVADRRPPCVPDVQRTRRVGAHELEVDRAAPLRVVQPEGTASLDDHLRSSPSGGGIQTDVDEAGTCNLDARDARRLAEAFRNLHGELARVHSEVLGELEGGVGRPVAMVAALGSPENDVGDRQALGCARP